MHRRNQFSKEHPDATNREHIKDASVFRLSISRVKGTKKRNVTSVTVTSQGIEGDAHAGTVRPVSLLPFESFRKLANNGLELHPGDFGENITTVGIDCRDIGVGTKLALGDAVILEIVQIGKECHDSCIIKDTTGNCIMPREGLFAKVIRGGVLTEGDVIRIVE
jgi:molybdopterin adenylyltransferase